MIRPRFVIQTAAARDLSGYMAWLAQEGDRRTADRFFEAAQTSFAALVKTPGLEPVINLRNRNLPRIQKLRVTGFHYYLIFYTTGEGGSVIILRVLHGAQDWLAMLEHS